MALRLISHASKVMLKILQARLQQYVNCELPDVQAGQLEIRKLQTGKLTHKGKHTVKVGNHPHTNLSKPVTVRREESTNAGHWKCI